MQVKTRKMKEFRLYTRHGEKIAQGIPSVINGKMALATFRGEKIIGYTTLEEINAEFFKKDLPKYELKF